MDLPISLKIRAFLSALAQEYKQYAVEQLANQAPAYVSHVANRHCTQADLVCASRAKSLPEDRGRYVRWGDEIK